MAGTEIRVEVEHLPRPSRALKVLWLWWSGPGTPDLDVSATIAQIRRSWALRSRAPDRTDLGRRLTSVLKLELWRLRGGEQVRRYKGLLLDFWGVLTTDLFAAYGRFCEDRGLPRTALCDLLTDDEGGHALLMDVERGLVEQPAFERAVAARLGVDGSRLVEKIMEHLQPEPLLLQLAERARRSAIRTGVLSNSLGMQPYDPYAPWRLRERFDVVVISGETQMRKPDPEIFTLALERLGVAAGACVFVDDMAHNLEVAQMLGMATVHHSDPTQTVAELECLLAL